MNDRKVALYLKLSELQKEFRDVLELNPGLDDDFTQLFTENFLLLNSKDDTWSINASNEIE